LPRVFKVSLWAKTGLSCVKYLTSSIFVGAGLPVLTELYLAPDPSSKVTTTPVDEGTPRTAAQMPSPAITAAGEVEPFI